MDDVTLRKTFSENLKRQIEDRKILKIELARACNFAPSRVTEMLSGNVNVSVDTIETVAKALNIPPIALLLPAPETAAV